MTRPEYKMTEIGEIPEEWNILPLTKLAKYINGMAFKPSDWKKQGIPIVRIENLNDSSAPFNYFDEEVDNKFLLNDGDILLSWSASLGVYIWNRGKAVLNQHIFKVVPNETVNKYYLFWALHNSVETLSKVTHGSTMKHFQKGELERTKIALPSLSEQQKIAEVLSTADETIQKANEEITLTEKHKKGLMQTLLTKGIGHTKFKITEIGEIPEEWCVKMIQEYANVKYGRSNPKTKGTIPLIGSSGAFGTVGEALIPTPTIVIGRKGTAGAVWDIKTPSWPSDTSFYLEYKKEISQKFLFEFMSLNKLTGENAKTTLPSVKKEEIEKFLFPLPPIIEQQKIAEILTAVDNKLELLGNKKAKLEKLKKGLMGDLLTGKIRVKLNTSKGED